MSGSDAVTAAPSGLMKQIGARTYGGAVKSVELTRRAVSAINPLGAMTVDRITGSIPKVPIGTHSTRLAQLFRHRPRDAPGAGPIIPEDISSDDDDVQGSLAELEQRVDRKYFDVNFDGLRAEVYSVGATYAEGQSDIEKELQQLETMQKERNEQLRAINGALKRRVLENYEVFVDGVCRIKDVNGDLLETAQDCRTSRERLSVARQRFIVSGLEIPRMQRRRNNMNRVLALLAQLRATKARSAQLRQLHSSHRFRELADIAAQQSKHSVAAEVASLTSAQGFLSEWNDFVKDPEALLRDADAAVEACIARKFSLDAYTSAIDAYVSLGSTASGAKRITTRLLSAGSTIVQRAISDLAGKVQGDVATVAAAVPPEAVGICTCQICAKVLQIIVVVKSITDFHQAVVDRDDPARSAEEIELHRTLLASTTSTAVEMGISTQFSIIEAAENLFLRDDTTLALHIFYLFSLAIEATNELGVGSAAMVSTRERLKGLVKRWVSEHVVVDRAVQLVASMENETWQVDSDTTPEGFSLVANLSPSTFRRDVKRVKAFIVDRRSEADNPFYDPALTLPQDTSNTIDVRHFTPTQPHSVIVPTASLIGNAAFIFVARIVARYPPLATEALGWLEQLWAIYSYVAAANFISVSRLTPLEDQHDFSPSCRSMLKNMREQCLTVLPDTTEEDGSFPPAVYEQIRDRFGSQDHLFAIVERIGAMESAVVIADLAKDMVRSLAPLLSKSSVEAQLDRAEEMRRCAMELLHVGTHRLANAAFPLDWLAEDLSRTKWVARDGMQCGAYVSALSAKLEGLQSKVARRLHFPSRSIENAFWQHVCYAVQVSMIGGFSGAKRKSDSGVSQMSVDMQAINEVLREALGANAVARGCEKFGSLFLRSYFGSPDERTRWLEEHHTLFRRDDLVSWLADDRESKAKIDGILRKVGHEDRAYVEHFILADSQLSR